MMSEWKKNINRLNSKIIFLKKILNLQNILNEAVKNFFLIQCD